MDGFVGILYYGAVEMYGKSTGNVMYILQVRGIPSCTYDLFAENKLYLASVCERIQQLGSPLFDYGDSSIVTMAGSVRQCMHAAELVGSPGMVYLMDFAHLVGRKTKAQNGEKFNTYVNMFHYIYDRNIQKEHLWLLMYCHSPFVV